MSAEGIRAGKAFVEIGGNDAPLQAAIARAKERLTSLGASLAKVGGGMMALGGGALGAMSAAALAFSKTGDEISKMAERTGVSAEALSELKFALQQSGTDLTTFESALARMQRGLTAAADGSQSMANTFQSLGLSVRDLAGLSPEQQFEEIAKAIGKIKSPTEQAARAMEIFGRSGTKLLPAIQSDMAKLRQEARDLGITMSTTDVQAAADLDDAMNRMSRTIQAAWENVGKAMAPVLTFVANAFSQIMGPIALWIDQNRQLTITVAGVATGLVALGAVLVTAGGSLAALGVVVGALIPAVTFLAGAFAAISSPVVIAGVAAAALVVELTAIGGVALYVANQAGLLGEAWSGIKSVFTTLAEVVQRTMGGVSNALSAGKYVLAAQVLWAGLKLTFLKGAAAALDAFGYLWKNAWSITTRFLTQLSTTVYNVFKQFPKLILSALQGGASLAEIIGKALSGAFDGKQVFGGAIGDAEKELQQLLAKAQRAKARSNQPKGGQQNQTGRRANVAIGEQASEARRRLATQDVRLRSAAATAQQQGLQRLRPDGPPTSNPLLTAAAQGLLDQIAKSNAKIADHTKRLSEATDTGRLVFA